MKREILIVTVLMTNIAFASTLPVEVREVREIDANKNKINTLADAAGTHLHKRGLDKDIANQKVLKSLRGNEYANSLMAQKIIENFNEIKYENIIAYVSNCALFEKSVDLSSYDDIIALVQKRNRSKLNKVDLKKVEKISLENKSIKLLHELS